MTERELAARLLDVGVEENECEAGIIFRELSGKSGAELRLGQVTLDNAMLEEIIRRRKEHEPLAYILGYQYFYLGKFKVTPDVLIPRQDTELLVSTAARELKGGERILDLCTGSGCVGISTLVASERTTALLVDISERALDIAKENAEQNRVGHRVSFAKMDVLRELPPGKFDAILSNPPYVSEADYKTLAPELYREPSIAFLGGEDGCDFYRAIIPRLDGMLTEGGFAAFEVGYNQAEAVGNFAELFGFTYEICKDFCNHNRVVLLRRVGEPYTYE